MEDPPPYFVRDRVKESMKQAWAEGYAEGFAEGFTEGRDKAKQEVYARAVTNMIRDGVSLDRMVTSTGLPEEEVLRIAGQMRTDEGEPVAQRTNR